MKKDQQKLLLYGTVGLLALYVLYRYYQNRTAQASSATQTNPQDQAAADYASLAGQEQADVAALAAQQQQGIAGVQTQEAYDIATLNGQIAALGGTATPFLQLQQELKAVTGLDTRLHQEILKLQAGHKPPGKLKLPPGFFYGRKAPHAPAGFHYVGLGQNWWQLVKSTVKQVPEQAMHPTKPGTYGPPPKPEQHMAATHYNPHTTAHQAGVVGHNNGHAGGAVAASSHAPKPTVIRKPMSGGAHGRR